MNEDERSTLPTGLTTLGRCATPIPPINRWAIIERPYRDAIPCFRRSYDSAVVAAIVAELSQYDIWVAHNGQRFDVPFLRTRLLAHAMDPLPAKNVIDPVLLARNKLRMSFNSLAQVAQHLGVNNKTIVEPQQWLAAALDGSRRAMRYIVDHCVQDVLVLEKVIGALNAYSGTYNTYGSGF